MTAEPPLAQVPEPNYPRILGANGPKMLALAGEIADGAMPILVPPEYTAKARQILGTDKIFVVGLTTAVDTDPDRARGAARRFVSEVVDVIIAWGTPKQVAAGVRKHLDAGADHVRLGTIEPDFQAGLGALEQLAPALTR